MTRPELLRNLEQIQEAEGRPKGPRAGTLLLASLGAACVIFAVVSQSRQKPPTVGAFRNPRSWPGRNPRVSEAAHDWRSDAPAGSIRAGGHSGAFLP